MSNKILPRDTLFDVQRMNLVDFGVRAPVRPSAAAPEKQAPTQQAAQETALAQAREQGFAEGLAAARLEMQTAIERQRGEFNALVANLDLFCKDLDGKLAEHVLAMSLELARLIVRQSLRVNPDLILPMLREAMAGLPGIGADTVLYLHPEDAALLRAAAQSDAGLSTTWKLVDDAQIERGGCRIETSTTEVDATLETRWKRIVAAIGRDDAWIAGVG